MALTDTHRSTLAALADVFVPAVRAPSAADEGQRAFFGQSASDAGTPERVLRLLGDLLEEDELADLGRLLTVLRVAGIGHVPYGVAQGILSTLSSLDQDAADGLRDLRQLTMVAHYGATDGPGAAVLLAALGHRPPPAPVAADPDRLPVLRPPDGADGWELEADVVVVGSGAGGAVVAARLAAAGSDVVVLEAGGANREADFPEGELDALHRLYWRHGLATTEDGNVSLVAGGTLGGGTTVNWSNCVPPPAHVRSAWAQEHGLEGLDGAAFDADLAFVADRIGASDEHTGVNGPNGRLLEGAKALGWAVHTAARNVDPALEDDAETGRTGFGDRSGAKLGSLRTWLPDAVGDGARIVADCRVDRVLHAGGRATGVEATCRSGGTEVAVRVRAATVVVACGALETPALLLRSGIGGPAVGRHLRLHPVPVLSGLYDERQRGWSGPPQGVVVTEHAARQDGYGYLVESAHWHPGLTAGGLTWSDARAHKLVMGRTPWMAPFLAVTRERGAGSVTVDERGEAVVHYPLTDPFDRAMLQHGVRSVIELHAAAGARAIVDGARDRHVWRRGDDLEAFVERAAAVPLGAAGRALFSAHQMGSARMGTDPSTSVADPDGQLHDVRGVWIGDTAAFPTAVGSNPMLTTMALAHRTAGRILGG